MGQEVAGYLPLGGYLNYLRILNDPTMRKTASNDFNIFQNFMYPTLNTLPGTSKLLQPTVIKTGPDKGEIGKYDIPTETLKFLWSNLKSINKKERAQYVLDEINSGKVRKRIEKNTLSNYKKLK